MPNEKTALQVNFKAEDLRDIINESATDVIREFTAAIVASLDAMAIGLQGIGDLAEHIAQLNVGLNAQQEKVQRSHELMKTRNARHLEAVRKIREGLSEELT